MKNSALYLLMFFSGLLALSVSETRADVITLDEAYAVVVKAHEQNMALEQGAADMRQAGSANLSGLWSSSAYPGLQVRLVDKGGVMYGLAKVPNSQTGGDLYHVRGGYSGTTVVLTHYSQENYKVFVGTISGSVLSGNLMIYNNAMVQIGTVTGVTMTKSPASGEALSGTTLNGKWSSTVLSKSIQGTMAMSLLDGVGEQVGYLEGSLNVPTGGSGTVPYHFIGYYLNNGEVFLCNTSNGGATFRTLLGESQASGSRVAAAVEENTVYFAGAPVNLGKLVFSIAPLVLLGDN